MKTSNHPWNKVESMSNGQLVCVLVAVTGIFVAGLVVGVIVGAISIVEALGR
jgi:hypothetical protein